MTVGEGGPSALDDVAFEAPVEGFAGCVERLREVFSAYPPPDRQTLCPTCFPGADADRISRGAGGLDERDLRGLACEAVSCIGGEIAFRHFLPRQFETGTYDGMGNLRWRLRQTDWPEWPEIEPEALRRALARRFVDGLAGTSEVDLEECFADLCFLGVDPVSVLSYVRPLRTAAAVRFATGVVIHDPPDFGDGRRQAGSGDPDWRRRAAAARAIAAEAAYRLFDERWHEDLFFSLPAEQADLKAMVSRSLEWRSCIQPSRRG